METYVSPWEFITAYVAVGWAFHFSIHFAFLPMATRLWSWFAD